MLPTDKPWWWNRMLAAVFIVWTLYMLMEITEAGGACP
jgi:hypothetical protein